MVNDVSVEGTTPSDVMVRPQKINCVHAKRKLLCIDTDAVTSAQNQKVPDMIEMLFNGVITQKSVVSYLSFAFNTFYDLVLLTALGITGSKLALRYLRVLLLSLSLMKILKGRFLCAK